jgi:hypothetical protein
MAKTNFINGTIVTASFLNSIYNTTNGHVHDGGSDDGHVSKIDLASAAHVTGALPLANQVSHVHDGTERGLINLANAAHVTGALPLANQVSHVHDGTERGLINLANAAHVTGALPLANQVSHVHDGNERSRIHPVNHVLGISEDVFQLVFPDTQFATTQNCTCRYRKEVSSSSGVPDIIRLVMAGVIGLSKSATISDLSGNLPASIRPGYSLWVPLIVINQGEKFPGAMYIYSTGNVYFAINTVDGFTSVGFSDVVTDYKGFEPCVITYPCYSA